MGRPLNKKYFGNTTAPYSAGTTGTGGEGLASVALGTAGTGYSQGLTATVSAPGVDGGVNATVAVAVNPATGAITGYTVVEAGSGYITAPTITLVPSPTVARTGSGTSGASTITLTSNAGVNVGMQVSGDAGLPGGGNTALVTIITGNTITLSAPLDGNIVSVSLTFTDIGASGIAGAQVLTAARQNAIAFSAQVTGGADASTGDIIKQVSSRRYKVYVGTTTDICVLTAASNLADGQMSVIATDVNGSTYYVTKLTAHKATLTQLVMNTAFLYATDDAAPWSFDAASSIYVQVASK